MTLKQCQIHIRKDSLKFSAAHMTVFRDGSKEALHGHNYFVQASFDIIDSSLEGMIPFSDYKKIMAGICQEWDEKVLLAKNCPFFALTTQSSTEIDFKLCTKRYVLPKDEVVFLACENITSEALAELFCYRFLDQFKSLDPSLDIHGIEIRIEESPGQGASFAIRGEALKKIKGLNTLVEV